MSATKSTHCIIWLKYIFFSLGQWLRIAAIIRLQAVGTSYPFTNYWDNKISEMCSYQIPDNRWMHNTLLSETYDSRLFCPVLHLSTLLNFPYKFSESTNNNFILLKNFTNNVIFQQMFPLALFKIFGPTKLLIWLYLLAQTQINWF